MNQVWSIIMVLFALHSAGNCSQEPGGEVVGKEQQKYFT